MTNFSFEIGIYLRAGNKDRAKQNSLEADLLTDQLCMLPFLSRGCCACPVYLRICSFLQLSQCRCGDIFQSQGYSHVCRVGRLQSTLWRKKKRTPSSLPIYIRSSTALYECVEILKLSNQGFQTFSKVSVKMKIPPRENSTSKFSLTPDPGII